MQALKVCFRLKNDFLTVKAGLVRIVEYCDHYHYTLVQLLYYQTMRKQIVNNGSVI